MKLCPKCGASLVEVIEDHICPTTGPDDSYSDFIKSHHFASYGNEGQYQSNETKRNTSNKLYHWRNNK